MRRKDNISDIYIARIFLNILNQGETGFLVLRVDVELVAI